MSNTKSGVLNLRSIGVKLLVCEGQILMNETMIRLHEEHCKNPRCPAKTSVKGT